MNKEIKEILEFLQPIEDRHCATLGNTKCKLLLDYITNLQQINDNLTTSLNKKIEEGINLQQENYELKSKLECYENGAYYSSKVDELEQENERLNNLFEYNMQTLVNTDKLLENYKYRCEKAIEQAKEKIKRYESYINDLKKGNYPSPTIRQERQELIFRIREQKDLLNILQNGSDEE